VRFFVLAISGVQMKAPEGCPEPGDIEPCTCTRSFPFLAVTVRCMTSTVTQQSVNNLFDLLRLLAPNPDELVMAEFSLESTNMATLDLTPLVNTTFELFVVQKNQLLQSINGPSLEYFAGSYRAKNVKIADGVLNDHGLGQSLKYFSVAAMNKLTFARNKLSGSPSGFLADVAVFTNLIHLTLDGLNLSRIEGGQFKTLTNLQDLYLGQYPINAIGQDAFTLDPPLINPLRIFLPATELTNAKVNPNHGLDKIQTGVHLYLVWNDLETLSSANFESFLRAHRQNSMDVYVNKIFCDGRLKWLKDNRNMFESRVQNSNCINDPGENIFTSDLI
jgi:hypothetical protein